MASLSAVFTEKEKTNWLKAWLAVDITKSGLEQFVENGAKTLHTNIFNNVWSINISQATCSGCQIANLLECPTKGVCNKHGAQSTCTSMHDNAAKQPRPCPANVCNKVHDEIVKQHKFKKPSWKNTIAQQWTTNPWQIAKAYFPPDGYAGQCSVQETDFNGIISFMMNCKDFDNKFSFPIATGKHNAPCLLTKAREIGRIVRHSSQCKVTDADLQDIFTTLTKLLSDQTSLTHDVTAQEAVKKLAELQKDTLKITTEEMMHLLQASQDTLNKIQNKADKSQNEMQTYLEQCKTDLNTYTNKCKQDLDDQTAKCTKAIDEHASRTLESTYEQYCEDFRGHLIEHYTTRMNTVSVSPLLVGLDKPIFDIFVQPKICFYNIEKDGSRKKTNKTIQQYKDFFYSDKKLKRVFVQGEPGIGKSTFLTKLVLDWCNVVSLHNHDNKATFSDIDTLNDFQFLFHISLRDAMNERDVVEMIKTQIIDRIYTVAKQTKAFELLQQILERETCLVTMDGLNEWADHLDQHVIPRIPTTHTKCVSIITTRPWKMADERIKCSEIDRLLEIDGITESEQLSKRIILSLQIGNNMSHTAFMTYINERNLMHFLTSPWMQELILNVWMNKSDVKGSLCEIHSILLDVLFKKAKATKGFFKNGFPIECLSSSRYIKKQIKIFDAVANAAFQLKFSSNKSPTFSEREIRKYLSEEHLQFCLNAGVLTARCNSVRFAQSPQYSFTHETVHEFLAAFHIASLKQDIIEYFKPEHNYNVLEMSQTIIYLCGLHCETAYKLLNRLVDGDFLSDICHGLSLYIKRCNDTLSAFRRDNYTKETVLKATRNEMDNDASCLAISVLFQQMVIAGFSEAKLSGQKDICLKCSDFTFNKYLHESESDALKELLIFNKSNVRSLILESNVLEVSEILSVMQQSQHSLERLKTTVTPEMYKALHNLNLKELHFIGQIEESSLSHVLPSLSNLMYLCIEDSNILERTVLPGTIQEICLLKSTFTAMFLQYLLVDLSSLKHTVQLYLESVIVTDFNTQIFLTEYLLNDMTNIHLDIEHGNNALYDTLRCSSIGTLALNTAGDVVLASKILNTLKKLRKLYLWGTYIEQYALKLPKTLQCVSLQKVECSAEWLCNLLIALSSLHHDVECELWDVVLQPCEYACGDDSKTHAPDLRAEYLSHMTILVENGTVELFEILRNTNIGKLDLRTEDCASSASTILCTLKRLTKLYLRGTYSGRCTLKLPATIQCMCLYAVECSAEWLCSLLIALSALNHSVECELWDVVLQPCEYACGVDSQTHVSDLRSKIMSINMSQLTIVVIKGSFELFEILRDTNIGILHLRTADCTSFASVIPYSLKKLTTLYLWGTYSERCTLPLSASLKCISLQEVKCSAEWLCSLLIALSALNHSVECELWDVVLQPCEYACGVDSQTHVSDLRSKIMSINMSQLTIVVIKGSFELFEILRDTNIGILHLRTADCASLASVILYSLKKLTKLYLCGTYSERCTLQLPASLQCISLQEVECSAEWLSGLVIALSSLDHSVEYELQDFVLQSRADARGDDFRRSRNRIHLSDLRSLGVELFKIVLITPDYDTKRHGRIF
ncbi:uncharacterized protein LOC127836583 [Dreissena polymorpha]|uniref:NACHT domain-containing protein n=1 Tax=Dreissena polymorpha TaxID=45954 RepID=A0A9D4G9G1_DREPO|nr:uncharacterized protein LOC127836583 [Dreissena polymorpha]KAH3811271.1 hypothetical protein DPMN_139679 [Dreissena polymorpha]